MTYERLIDLIERNTEVAKKHGPLCRCNVCEGARKDLAFWSTLLRDRKFERR